MPIIVMTFDLIKNTVILNTNNLVRSFYTASCLHFGQNQKLNGIINVKGLSQNNDNYFLVNDGDVMAFDLIKNTAILNSNIRFQSFYSYIPKYNKGQK